MTPQATLLHRHLEQLENQLAAKDVENAQLREQIALQSSRMAVLLPTATTKVTPSGLQKMASAMRLPS